MATFFNHIRACDCRSIDWDAFDRTIWIFYIQMNIEFKQKDVYNILDQKGQIFV